MYFPLFSEDHAKWASYHDIQVFKDERGDFSGKLDVACEHLTKDNKCGVYGTDKRPKMCETYWCDESPNKEEVFFNMRISVITPSIRPQGLEQAFKSMQRQNFGGVEWLPRLSVPGAKPDLAYQMNQAVKEAQGELIVFLQDWIKIGPDALQKMWDFYKANPNTAITAPVGKAKDLGTFATGKLTKEDTSIKWDWRSHREGKVEYHEWEIDWGAAPKKLIVEAGAFEERYDTDFGFENVDLGYRLYKNGVQFKCDTSNSAIAFDHDAHVEHPYKGKSNQDLWLTRKEVIDLMFEGEE
jgi:hypothetical protein